MKYCVTGGAGFIGSHLVRRLLADGHKVVVLDDFSNSSRENVPEAAILFEGSITDKALLNEALQGCEGVFHLAAEISVPKSMDDPHYTLEVNSLGTLRLLEVMNKMHIPKLVYAGTSAVYGDPVAEKNSEILPPKPLSPYAYSKLQSEYFIKTFAHLHGLQAVIFRFFNVYGVGQNPNSPYAAVIPIFMQKAQSGEPLTIFGDGSQTRDFIYVEDVANLCIEAMSKNSVGLFNVGTGQSTSIKELAFLIKTLYRSESPIEFKNVRTGDIKDSVADNRLLEKTFAVEPRDLSSGLSLMTK